MNFKQVARFLHVCGIQRNQSVLATLRKKTGYPFSNCKKALDMHNNDLVKAEEWLKKQAQILGLQKATKLEGRSTKQGLIGILVQNNIGAMVEVNCETDFVAKNEKFHKFVENVTIACTNYISEIDTNNDLLKINLNNDELKSLKVNDGKTLADHLALMIGNVGENASLRRAICFKSPTSISLYGYAHPTITNDDVPINTTLLGKYGSIVAFKSNNVINSILKKNLCQHIVGMNPVKLGEKDKDEPTENKDDETCLIHQEYLLDPEINVGELLEENQIQIIDFQRFECGENTEEKNELLNKNKAVN